MRQAFGFVTDERNYLTAISKRNYLAAISNRQIFGKVSLLLKKFIARFNPGDLVSSNKVAPAQLFTTGKRRGHGRRASRRRVFRRGRPAGIEIRILEYMFQAIRKFQSAGRLPPENSVALINPVNEGS
jgi:hypothetical protein